MAAEGQLMACKIHHFKSCFWVACVFFGTFVPFAPLAVNLFPDCPISVYCNDNSAFNEQTMSSLDLTLLSDFQQCASKVRS